MYRPNRIGPWPIVDIDQTQLVRSDANFDSLDGGNDTFGCFSLMAAAGVEYQGTNVHWTSAVILAAGSAVGIGVMINFTNTTANPMLSISANISALTTSQSLLINCCVGRLAATLSTTAQVLVTNPTPLPMFDANLTLQNFNMSVDTSLITQTGISGGTIPSTEFDLAVFWHLRNEAGATVTLTNLAARISVHSYLEDMLTFDPAR